MIKMDSDSQRTLLLILIVIAIIVICILLFMAFSNSSGSSNAQCQDDGDCVDGVCQAGKCQQCAFDSDCCGNENCRGGKCVPGDTDGGGGGPDPNIVPPTLSDFCELRNNDNVDPPKNYGPYNIVGVAGTNPIDWTTLRIVSVQVAMSENVGPECGDSNIPFGTNTSSNINTGASTLTRIGGTDYGVDDDVAGVDIVEQGSGDTNFIDFRNLNDGTFQIECTSTGLTWPEIFNYTFRAVVNVADTVGVRSNDANMDFFLDGVT